MAQSRKLSFRSFSHDPSGGLAEVLTWRFLFLSCWMAGLLLELVGLPLRFIGLGSFLCHTDSFP